MRKTIAAFVASILAVVALVVGASTANAQPTGSINIVFGDEGHLLGKGVVVTLPAEITCTISGDFQFGDGFAGLRQAQGRTIVSAMGGASLSSTDCDGTPHFVNFTFFPTDAPFKPGLAVVSGSVSVCFVDPTTGESACASDSEEPKEIRLTKN
jgi:hypothetical protein